MVARPGEELLGALEEALRAELVREDAEHVDRFAFAHALVRETLYDAPAHARRARLHLRAGQALEAAGAPRRRARPPLLRRARGRRRRAPRSRTAPRRRATRSRAHAYEEAAWHLEQALAARCERRRAAMLLLALGDVRWQASEPGARRRVRRGRRSSPAARGRPTLLARAALGAGGRFYMPTAADAAYVARLEEALTALGDADERAARAAARPARRAPRARRRRRPLRPRSAPRRSRWRAAAATTARSPPR